MNWQGKLNQQWIRLSIKEKKKVVALGWILFLFLTWQLCISPALHRYKSYTTQKPALIAKLEDVNNLRSQAEFLKKLVPPPFVSGRQWLERSVKELTGEPALSFSNSGAIVTFKNINSSELFNWIADARSTARLDISRVTLERNTSNNWAGSIYFELGND